MKIYRNIEGVEEVVLDILVDDSSVRYRSIMGDNSLTLNFSTVEPASIAIGAYCDFEGQRYTLFYPENFKKHNTRNFEYTLVLHGSQESLKLYKFKDLSAKPYRLKFPLTATAEVFLQLLVDNMNEHDAGWSSGDCIVADDRLISFNHEYCYDVLNRVAQEFNTEWEIENKTIHLRKVEKFKDDPLALSYGKGNGFKSGVGRTNESDKQPIGRLYVQGGERNIDFSTYGSSTLLLPKSGTLVLDGKTYKTDADGMYITRVGNNNVAEDSYDANDIYPKRVGTVGSVIVANAEKNFYDIVDSSIPESLNYRNCRIAGEKATIIFQSGALAGREFDILQTENDLTGYDHALRKFEIVPQELDGMTMPGGVFVPAVGDKYAIFNISMPQAYISDDETKSGASWDMFREAVKYFAENEEPRFSFRGELDGVWSKSKWLQIGGKIVPGGYVLFSDTQFQPEGVKVRITSIKDYVNMPHKPEITLSNAPVSGSFGSTLGKLEAEEVVREEQKKELIRFNKRTWSNAKQTIAMLEDAIEGFDPSISPATVQTMAVLVGSDNTQFNFRNNQTVSWNKANKTLTASYGNMRLMMNVKEISPVHDDSKYGQINVSAYTSPALTDPKKSYYLYISASKNWQYVNYFLSETAYKFDSVEDWAWYFLVGILNSEDETGNRDFVRLHGFTEILPGRINTEKIVSTDGKTYFDLVNGVISGRLKFINENNQEEDISNLNIYTLQPSLSIIKKGSSSHANISCRVMFTSPAGTVANPHLPAGYYINCRIDDGSQFYYTANTDIATANIHDKIEFLLYRESTYITAIDKVSIAVVNDGSPGTPGSDGEPGTPGTPGENSYTHFRYSQNANGNPMSESPTNAIYIGVVSTNSAIAPTLHTDYKWTRIKGGDGEPGTPGEDGDGFAIRYMRANNRPAKPQSGVLNPAGWMSQIDNPTNNDIYWTSFVGEWTKQSNGEYKSKEIEHNKNSPLRFNFYNRTAGSELKLTVRTSSESSDKLYVGKLDESLGENYANARLSFGDTQSQELTYALPAKGEHYILFDYKKDSSVNSGSDAAFVKIELPIQSVWMTIANVTNGVVGAWSEPALFIDHRIEETIAATDRSKAITDKFGTTIEGGLINTVMMILREANSMSETAGISGIQGINRNHPAFWAGGTSTQAVALIEFLAKIASDITPDVNEYFNLARITMLHNGAAKIGDFIVEESGRVTIVDPTSGKARLVFSQTDIPKLSELLAGTSYGDSAVIGTGSLTMHAGGQAIMYLNLSGSTYISKGGSTLTIGKISGLLSMMHDMVGYTDSEYKAEIEIVRDGVKFASVYSMLADRYNPFIYFDSDVHTIGGCSVGTYSVRIKLVGMFTNHDVTSYADLSIYTTAGLSWSFVQSGIRRLQFGRDGMMGYFSNNHFHLTEDGGLDVRGTTNMPGVLCSGSVTPGGTMTKKWGAKVKTSGADVSRPSVGEYNVYHTIGHNDYNVSVTAQGESLPSVTARYNDYFVVNMRGRGQGELQYAGFDFQVFGRNY